MSKAQKYFNVSSTSYANKNLYVKFHHVVPFQKQYLSNTSGKILNISGFV